MAHHRLLHRTRQGPRPDRARPRPQRRRHCTERQRGEGYRGRFPHTALALPLDVTDKKQISSAVQQAQARFGGIDVLVNNAGYGYRAAVEEADDADVRQLFDTNLFGAVDMIKAVLPDMRVKRAGAILNISSIGARISPAGSGYYSATKAALEGLSGSLHKELRPLGISVTAIEPGAFRTDFAGRSLTQSATAIPDYAETAGKRRKENDTVHGTQPGDPARQPRRSSPSSKARTRRRCWSSARTPTVRLPPSPTRSARNWTSGAS